MTFRFPPIPFGADQFPIGIYNPTLCSHPNNLPRFRIGFMVIGSYFHPQRPEPNHSALTGHRADVGRPCVDVAPPCSEPGLS